MGGQLIGLVCVMIVSRRIAPDVLGAWAFCASLSAIAGVGVNFVTTLGIRDVSSGAGSFQTVALELTAIQLATAATLYTLLVLSVRYVSPSHDSASLIAIVALVLFTNALSFEWALQVADRLGTMGLLRLASQVLFLALTLLMVRGGLGGARRFALANIAGYGVVAIGSMIVATRLGGVAGGTLSRRGVSERIRRSLPGGYALAMVQIYYYADVVILGYLRPPHDVGVYAVAARIPLALMATAGIWTVVIVPHAASLQASASSRLSRDVGAALTASVVVAVGAATGAALVASGLMRTLFGDNYRAAALPFALLVVAFGIVLIATNVAPVVFALGDSRSFAIATTFGAIVNLGVNFSLIPRLGGAGAAVATVAAEAVVVGYMSVVLRRRLRGVRLASGRIARGIVASAVASGVTLALPWGDAVLRLSVFLAVFASAAWIGGAIDPVFLRDHGVDEPAAQA